MIKNDPGVDDPTQLVVRKGSNPDVHHGLENTDGVLSSLNEYCVIKEKEGDEKGSFEDLAVNRYPQAGIRICCSSACQYFRLFIELEASPPVEKLGLFGRMYSQRIPEHDFPVPDIIDNSLNNSLA